LGFKRKASEASVKPPKKRAMTKKTTESEQCLDIDSLKSSLGTDPILKTLTCLSDSVKKLTNVGQCTAPFSGHSGESMDRGLSNNPPATITRHSAEFVSLNQENENDYFLNDFDLSYLDSGNYTPNSPSLVGVDPQIAFKDAFESSQNIWGHRET
jgi:hypothetical protein